MSMRWNRFHHAGGGALLLASALALGCGDADSRTSPTDTPEQPQLNRSTVAVSQSGVTPVLVEGNPSCATLNGLDATFPTITSDFGFKVESDYNRTVPMDGTASGTTLTGGAPADAGNTITLSSSDGIYLDWSSTLSMDAVIMKGGPDGNVYVYVPESFGDQGLVTPINPSNGQPYAISHVEFCYDYELTAEKTAETSYTRTYSWEIVKSVDPAAHTGFIGAQFTSSYDVAVDRTVTDSDWRVSGTVTVTNPTPFTVTFSVADVLVTGVTTSVAVSCPTTSLAPGESAICTYDQAVSTPADGNNTATVTVAAGPVQGATAEAPVTWGDPTTVVGDATVNVTDYFDGDLVGEALGSASDDATFPYDRDFACPSDPAEYTDGVYTKSFPNYAEIDETGQQDDAGVDLTCYALVVSKDASTEWFREYTWTIEKTVDVPTHTGFPGDIFTSNYTVTVDQTVTEYGWRAFGSIYVTNPSGETVVVDVADAVADAAATVNCGGGPGDTSLSVPPGAGTGTTPAATCDYTVDLGDETNRVNTATVTVTQYGDEVFTDGPAFAATADVTFGDPTIVGDPEIDVEDYFGGDVSGTALGSASADATFTFTGTFECPAADVAAYAAGAYSETIRNIAKILGTDLEDDANVALTCYLPAKAKVVKTTTEGSEDIGQFPLTFELYDPSDALVETQTLGTGGGEVFFTTDLEVAGTWTVKEVLPAGWVSTTDLTCDVPIAYPGSADQTYTCSFDDVEMSRVDLLKLTNGQPTTAQTWSFAIYAGPDGFGVEAALAADNTPPALLDFGYVDLDPRGTYTLCEHEVPAGYSTFWQVDTDGDGVPDTTVLPYNPNADDPESQDLGNRCVDFGADTNIPLVPGTTLSFSVDNQAPGGDPRTPGYWKNWNRVTGGGQQYTADANGGWQEGFWLLEDVLDPNIGGGIVWDDILVDALLFEIDAAQAVLILDKRDLNGKKQASDPLFNLATHLLAAQLNFGAGACTTQDVLDAALAAERLLDEYDFDGFGHDRLGRKDPAAELANQLAAYLDAYNNGAFCGSTNGG